ncbi:MAG: peptidylprolyl isomerase [Bacteroidota bacterium]
MSKERTGIADETLAVIGQKTILASTFKEFYQRKIAAAGLSDNIDTRINVLRTYVDDEILIAYAHSKHLERTPAARAELSRLQLQLLLNTYTERSISPTVHVSESDLREFFVRMNTKVKVRHLYASSKKEAEIFYTELTNGSTFNELAKQAFSDPQLQQNGGFLGYITVDEMDPAFEVTAFTIPVGQISKPVKTVQGYSILLVEDRITNPLLTETEFARVKERLHAFVHKRKFEEAARKFTETMKTSLAIRCDKQLMEKVFSVFKNRSNVSGVEDPAKSFSPKELRQTILWSNNDHWSINRFISEMKRSTERQWNWIKNSENLQDYATGLMIRSAMETAAKKEKLDKSPRYRKLFDEQFDAYLLSVAEAEFKKNIVFTADSLRSYYDKNRTNYKTESTIRLSGILLDRLSAADSVKMLLLKGVAFEELVRQFSIQSATAVNKGDLGYFTKKELESLDRSVIALSVGAWFGPIVEENKYLFLQCTEKKESVYRPFDEVKDEIVGMLVTSTWLKQRSHFVNTLKKEIRCSIFPERLEALSIVK